MICGTETGDIQDLQVKMIDFGMSKHAKGGKVDLSTYAGTINFMAPEVVNEDGYDNRCDLWSTGCVAFYMLTGELPFTGKDEPEIARKIDLCAFDYPNFMGGAEMEDARDFVDGLIAIEPNERFNSD